MASSFFLLLTRFNSHLKTPTKHKNRHHGKHPPPLVARILQLLPIRREPNADEWLGECTVEAIYLNRLIDSVLIKLLATLIFIKKLNETQLTMNPTAMLRG
jgi:hypothetical protein